MDKLIDEMDLDEEDELIVNQVYNIQCDLTFHLGLNEYLMYTN